MATTTFDNLITFSRGSNATVTGPNGLIQWAPSNVLTNSENFDASSWVKDGATITANATAAPDGSITAEKFVETATNATHQVYSGVITVAATATYTYSIYAKAGERNWLAVTPNDFTERYTWFNLAAGTIGTNAAGNTATITPVGNGWYRCTVTRTLSTTSTRAQYFVSNADNTPTYLGDGTSGIFIWGAQLELGSTATTYNNTSVRNLLGFSEAFDNAAWTKTRASMVTGAQANPVNGLFNAQKLMEDTTASNTHFVAQSFTAVAATIPYTFSTYARAAGRTVLLLVHANATTISFDLANGTCDAGGVIVNVGNGWYRCSVTALAPDTASRSYSLRLGAPSATYTGDGNSGVYIYGAMLSNSASLDPYVPTPAAAPSSTAYYGPRFDYDPVTLLPRGLLVEEARTNLRTYSQEFDNASWGKTGVTVTANSTTSPDGTINADSLIEDTATSVHDVVQSGALTAAAHTFSAFVKANGRSWVRLFVFQSGLVGASVWFNVATGAVGTVGSGATNATITNFGNGWYRCSFTFTALAAAASSYIQIATADNGPSSYTGNGTSGFFIYGAQLEAGAFATSYIPTIASTVTRSADIATITGSLFSQWYNQSEGTIIWTGNFPSFNLNRLVSIDAGVSARTADIFATSPNSISYFKTSDSQQIVINTATANALTNVALAVKANDYNGAVNSALGGSDTSTTGIATADRLSIGHYNSLNQLNGHIRSIRYVPVRAADFQLQQVTT